MSDELPSSPSDILAKFFHLGYLHHLFVGDSVLPVYLKYSSKGSVLEDVDVIFVTFSSPSMSCNDASRLVEPESYIA